MLLPIVPISKMGTQFQSPSWRYQLAFYPERFGFEKFCSQPGVNSGNLKRLISNGIVPVDSYDLPIYIKQLYNKLPALLYQQLIKVWDKRYFNNRVRKVTFNNNRAGMINWNINKVKKINDDYVQKLIFHCYNYEANEYISEAIKFYKTKTNETNCKWLNYSIYGNKTDIELAKQWYKPVKFIEALRLIFFDYSGWPKDKLVQYSCLRQLANNKEIDDADYHAFKRIYDLGELGLRSILGHQVLTEDERDEVKSYLAGAGVDNLMDQRFAITSLKESVIFNNSVVGYVNANLHRLELEQRAAVMRLNAQRIEKELGINETVSLTVEDNTLMENLREMMLLENPGKYPSYVDVLEVKP
jgi:hypothetical protein